MEKIASLMLESFFSPSWVGDLLVSSEKHASAIYSAGLKEGRPCQSMQNGFSQQSSSWQGVVNTNKKMKGLGKTLIKARIPLIVFKATQREPSTGYIFQTVGREKINYSPSHKLRSFI